MGDLREPEREHVYTMDEVREHTSENDAWIVVDDVIYDITNFWKKHPGGQNVIMAFAGMDASVRNFPVNAYIAYTFLRQFHTFRETGLVAHKTESSLYKFQAMYHLYHLRKDRPNKFLQFFEKGRVKPDSISERKRMIDKDYEELTTLLTKKVRTCDHHSKSCTLVHFNRDKTVCTTTIFWYIALRTNGNTEISYWQPTCGCRVCSRRVTGRSRW